MSRSLASFFHPLSRGFALTALALLALTRPAAAQGDTSWSSTLTIGGSLTIFPNWWLGGGISTISSSPGGVVSISKNYVGDGGVIFVGGAGLNVTLNVTWPNQTQPATLTSAGWVSNLSAGRALSANIVAAWGGSFDNNSGVVLFDTGTGNSTSIGNLSLRLGITANMDTAGNYMQWATAAGLSGNAAAPEARAFGDTVTNLVRYAMNLGGSGQGQFLPQPFVQTTPAGSFLVVQYRQRKNMSDVLLVPQYSTDFKNWFDVPAANITALLDDDNNTARYQASLPLSTGPALSLRVIARANSGPVTQWPVSAGGNGHYYQGVALPGRLNWNDAEAYAESRGGYLATITSDAENNFVFSLINAPQFWIFDGNTAGPWIGGYQAADAVEPAGGWTWVNNEGPVIYSAWTSSQPDNTYGTENRIQYWNWGTTTNRTPVWNDGADTWGAPSIVIEWNGNPGNN